MRIDFLEKPPITYTSIITKSVLESKPQYAVISEGKKSWFYKLIYDQQQDGWESLLITNNLIALRKDIGLYLFDTKNHEQSNVIEIPDGFEKMYYDKNELFITGPLCVYCITDTGALKWMSEQLGIDGVIIDSFTNNQITVSAQYDPPDGWEKYVLCRETGKALNSTSP